MQGRFQGRRSSEFERLLEKPPTAAPGTPISSTPAAKPATGTNALLSVPAVVTNTLSSSTNIPAEK
jgi:hypothetical protein